MQCAPPHDSAQAFFSVIPLSICLAMLIAQLGTQGPEFHVELNVCLRRSSYNGTKVTMIYVFFHSTLPGEKVPVTLLVVVDVVVMVVVYSKLR